MCNIQIIYGLLKANRQVKLIGIVSLTLVSYHQSTVKYEWSISPFAPPRSLSLGDTEESQPWDIQQLPVDSAGVSSSRPQANVAK